MITTLGLNSVDTTEDTETTASTSKTQVVDTFSVREFLTEDEIKDMGVKIAFKRGNPDYAIKQIEEIYRAKLRSNQRAYEAAIELINKEIEAAQASIATNLLKEDEISNRIIDLQRQKLDLENQLMPLREQRHTRETAFFVEERANLEEEVKRDYEEFLTEINYRKQVASGLSDLKLKEKDLNKESHKKRIDYLTERLDLITQTLKESLQRASILRRALFSDKAAGYLIWSGYTSLAGFTYFLTQFFEPPSKSGGNTTGLFHNLQSVMNGAIGLIQNGAPILVIRNALIFLSAISILIFLLIQVVTYMDKKVRELDPGWAAKVRKGKGKSKASSQSAEKENEIDSQIPDLNRRSYSKLLTFVPYLFIGAIVIAFAGIAGIRPPSDPGSPPQATFFSGITSAYLGFTFTLLVLSTSLVYTFIVMLPRWLILFNDTEKPPNPRLYIRAHWELIIVIILFFATLISFALATAPESKLFIAGKISGAAFMCLSSLWLSYGIVQRGVFKDLEWLEMQQAYIHAAIEEFGRTPNVWEYFEYDAENEAIERANYHRALRAIFDKRRIHQVTTFRDRVETYGRQFVDFAAKQWNRVLHWLQSSKDEESEQQRTDKELTEAQSPKKYSVRIQNGNKRIPAYLEVEHYLEERITYLVDQVNATIAEQKHNADELTEHKKKLLEMEKQRYEHKRGLINLEGTLLAQKEHELLIFNEAFDLGLKVMQELKI